MSNNYNSLFTGQHIDEYDARIEILENQITTLNNSITTLNNQITTLQDQVNDAHEIILAKAYYAGSGNGSFNGWIPFNTKVIDTKNCFNTSNGRFVVPKAGLYLVIFTYFSNETGVNDTQRPAIGHYNSSGAQRNYIFTVGNDGISVSSIYNADIGDYFVAGTYASNLHVNFFQANHHNEFTIAKIG